MANRPTASRKSGRRLVGHETETAPARRATNLPQRYVLQQFNRVVAVRAANVKHLVRDSPQWLGELLKPPSLCEERGNCVRNVWMLGQQSGFIDRLARFFSTDNRGHHFFQLAG